jgi:alpha-beta hydrolase superfamily lysophospholipase
LAPDTAIRSSLRSADGTALAYRAWPIEGATVTFAVVHGHGEHSGRYERFARGMARHRMATYAVDLRGHGESEGQRGHVDSWSQWVDDANAFIGQVEREATGEVIPLGHSMGGVVMLSAVRAGKLPNARRFIVSSPALMVKAKVPPWKTSLGKATASVVPRLSMSTQLDASVLSRIPEVVETYRGDPLVHSQMSSRLYAEWQRAANEDLEHAAEIKIPFLIIAGAADRLIDPAGSERLHRHAPDKSELHMLDGRYHEPFNDLESDEVFDLIARWVRR